MRPANPTRPPQRASTWSMRSPAAILCLFLPLAACASSPAGSTKKTSASPAPPPSADAALSAPPHASAVNEQGDFDPARTPRLAEPHRLYAQRDYAAAAAAFHALIEAPADHSHSRAERDAARFFLAKSLAHMGLRVAALALFSEPAQSGDPADPYRLRALPWLVHLADELPDDEPILRTIGRYKLDELTSLSPSQPEALVASARYYLGRATYNRGDLDRAVAILRGVPTRSRWSRQARFFEGVSLVRADDNEGALNAFQRAAQSPGQSAAQSPGQAEARGVPAEDGVRLRDLAWLSIARVHYAAAGAGGEDGEDLASSEALENALTAYKKVTAEGGYQDDALLEQAWVLLRLGRFARALESLDGLSPLFAEATPEASYLRALIQFSRCDIDQAEKTIAIFRQEYSAREGAALRLERASEAEILEGQPSAGFSLHMPAVVRGALAQRDVKRRFELLALIKAEKEILAALPSDPKTASLRAYLFQAEARAEQAASERITAIVRARGERFLAESRQQLERADRITIEIQAIRGGNTKCSPRGGGAIEGPRTGG